MQHVTGIGGIFFKARDADGMRAWYRRHLGIDAQSWGYRVADLAALLDTLRAEGCDVDDKIESSEFGKFCWVMDPEGNRVELWEPPPARSGG